MNSPLTAAPHATRITANATARELELLAREAQDVADAAQRFASNVDRALAHGDAQQLAVAVRALELRATKVTAMRETAELFTTELNPEVTP